MQNRDPLTNRLDVYAKRKNLKHVPITDKWGFRFINQVLLPISGVLSFIIAIYWAADVFNMSDTTWMIFNKDYIKTSNFTASLYSVTQVACLYFLFKYIQGYPGVYHIIARHLLVVSCDDIPLPQ